jgi:hypothetical protein
MRLKDTIIHRMVELAGDPASGWTALGGQIGATVRYTKTRQTPDYMRGTGFGRWDQGTYDTHVFLTLVAGKFILGVASAPWVGRSDSDVPLWLVQAILEDPDLAHDDIRRNAMRNARKAARS